MHEKSIKKKIKFDESKWKKSNLRDQKKKKSNLNDPKCKLVQMLWDASFYTFKIKAKYNVDP